MNIITAIDVHVNQMVGSKSATAFKTHKFQMKAKKLTLVVRIGVRAKAQEIGEFSGLIYNDTIIEIY